MYRFWSKVKIGEPEECWEWQAHCTKTNSHCNYGHFRLSGKIVHAHRIAWLLSNGPIPQGICVLHKCDNAPCCNPAHLFLGTQADNVSDMILKGREAIRKGVLNGRAKLTESQVISIRQKYAQGGISYRMLAAIYEVGPKQIGQIIRRDQWTHIEIPYRVIQARLF